MLSYARVRIFMEKLNDLIHCENIPSINNPSIIHERPQFQLIYDELDNSLFQTLFTQQYQDLEKVNDLKERFTDTVQEAEYIIDLFLSVVHISNTGEVNSLFPASLNLDDVMTSFNFVKLELTSMNITDPSPVTLNQFISAAAPVSITRGSRDETIVGLEYDVELIRDKLVEDQKKVDVVSIVGMGGIGKTTLAAKVFNDDYVKYHFYVRVWVTVSQTYDKRNVLIQILESIRGQLHLQKGNSDSRLREMVHKHLMGQRYLIVIDDIWDIETWDDLKLFFPHDNNGSRILLTTRLTEVAKHANIDGLIHPVRYLSKERSWEMMCKKVFHGDEYPEWSYNPGMQIVENCKGLPLAVAVIAGVLAKEARSEKFWVKIVESTGLYFGDDQNGCMETLGLSYNHLPLHLRECFLYFGGFPEDYVINVKMLIWLWMAEGFIEQDGSRSLEDVAEGYLMDLVDRNLVFVRYNKSNGGMKACKMHDLVRELCVKKGNEEGFFNKFPNDTNIPYKPAHMLGDEDINFLDFPYPSVRNLRAILWFRSLSDDIARCFHSFVLLRMLDIRWSKFNDFPEGIELLVHLRYLAISVQSIDFPSSICNLWNLQTLVYGTQHDNGKPVILPSNISNLVNLRHLVGSYMGYFLLPSIERPMKLQTISCVEFGDGMRNLPGCFPYLKELECLSGTLDNEFGLKSLTYLETLKVTGRLKNPMTFPATLKTLTLARCTLVWSDMSMIQSLPNLEHLNLKRGSFSGRCWNTDGQVFPRLKLFRLKKLLNFVQWEAYATSFPCLRQLEILKCLTLKEISPEIGEIPTLELVKIDRCWPSVANTVIRIQEEQHYLGNYNLEIIILT